MEILIPVLSLGGIGLAMGLFLAYASKKFEVEIDPNVEKVNEVLPGMNCGACGFPGCSGYAEAVALEGADITACAPGGPSVVEAIAEVMGMTAEVSDEKIIARVKCQGDNSKTTKIYDFDVELKTCATAMLYFGGDKSCWHSCLGHGDCVSVCPVNAIKVNAKGIAEVDEEACVSCGKCAKECPKNVIAMMPQSQRVTVLCSSREKGAQARKSCAVACIGCGLCARTCPVDAITVNGNLAKIDHETCINCGLCAIKCPTNAIISEIKEIKRARIIEDKCIGCTACSRVCPVDAIEGKVKEKHIVIEDKCIGCQLCYEKCKFNAIEMDIKEVLS